ncbi:MAG: methyl-accepting chemotaxis protein signaling domain protein [Candidatus Magnetoglobus multicellularis str. Araruama]|uniref:Methyl-accepting chemotaxis protein signaling domain protein n=1 Tax=Candidatus Magnetoglobus multicellularis str. Araruama TaxID=890399 RepID=A0A1V1P1H1_9BACT|nr:MAG: methyl-accepting chemotaxis protein signaling domain protein [Candidatus Magnetoglobus multicellularis str. Araruama]
MAETFTTAYTKHFELIVETQHENNRRIQEANLEWKTNMFSHLLNKLAFDSLKPSDHVAQWIKVWLDQPGNCAISITDIENTPIISVWKSRKSIHQGIEIPASIRDQFDHIVSAKLEGKPGQKLFAFYSIQADTKKGALVSSLREQIRSIADTNKSQFKRMILAQMIGFLIILIIFIGFQIWQFRRLVLRPLTFINRVANRLASFDLTVSHHPKSKDEIGQIFQAYNGVIKAFREILSLAQENGRKLSKESEQIIHIFSRLNNHVNDMEKRSNTVVCSAYQMSSTMSSIADSLNGMKVNVEKISKSTDAMTNNIHSVAVSIDELSSAMNGIENNARNGRKIAEKAVEKAKKTVQTISSLNNAASQIEDITHIIMSIADKTNLIGLNAAIEAASAGDSGRGFTVVAKSIQKFAEQSTRAAINISEKITTVLDFIDDSIKMINDIVKPLMIWRIHQKQSQHQLKNKPWSQNKLQRAQTLQIKIQVKLLVKWIPCFLMFTRLLTM